MKIVNRGFLIVKPKQAFCDWAKTQDPEFIFDEEDDVEPSVYLVDEDVMEVEPLIESNFKKIFINECEAVTEDDDAIPEPNFELFSNWFAVEYGGCVYDVLKADLRGE